MQRALRHPELQQTKQNTLWLLTYLHVVRALITKGNLLSRFQALLKHTHTHTPRKKPWKELRTRADLEKAVLECPPLARLRPGIEGCSSSLKGRRLKGGHWIFEQTLRKIQVDFLILHYSCMTEHPEERLLKTYSLLFYIGMGRIPILFLFQCLFDVKFHLDLSWSENPQKKK